MDIVKQTGSRGSPVKRVDSAVDGHSYYIINGDDSVAKAAVHFIDFYGGLAQYSPVTSVGGVEKIGNVEGFFFVRNAADMSIKGDGRGDPTVHAGWAMYIWDAKDYIARKPATNAGWVKISQQGDMDWDITDELKSMFVLKTVFNARVNEVDTRFSQDEAILKQVNNRLTIIENDWPEVLRLKHWHDNKEVLDELSDQYTFLYYRGRPISGNSYVYDHVEYRTETGQKEIVWCDPTKKEAEWTHEIVKNSDEIAQRFKTTAMARIGLSLFVIEVDGSITIYKYGRGNLSWSMDDKVAIDMVAEPPVDLTVYHPKTKYFTQAIEPGSPYVEQTRAYVQEQQELLRGQPIAPPGTPAFYFVPPTGSDDLEYKFAQTIVQDNHGVAEYVETLPTATKWHYRRGCWVPLKDDGEHIVGHLHKCLEFGTGTTADPFYYKWVDIHDSGSSIETLGAAFTIAYSEDTTLWKTNHLFWKDPEDTVTVSGIPVKWSQTILVRKYGSASTNVNDGVMIITSSVRNEHTSVGVTDVIPQTNETVYYTLFSRSKAGGYYAAATSAAPTKLDWTKILEIIRAGNADKIFAIGDEVVLPPHATYGNIVCEVVDINKTNDGTTENGLLLVSKGVICQKYFDVPESKQTSTAVPNPEWTDGVARGSNGYIHNSIHDASSLNIIRWLNSEKGTDWWEVPTGGIWDVKPTDSAAGYVTRAGIMEAGFLNGFEEADRAIFKTMKTETDGSTFIDAEHSDLDLKVSIPMYNSGYFSKIPTKLKQLGRAKAIVEWGTLTGVATSMTETRQRINYGFTTILENTTSPGVVATNSKIPESTFGIVPMFFIG